MDRHPVAEAYDRIAEDYDALVVEDFWMRRLLWAHYTAVFRPGAHVLDVACGTGLDSLFLAAQGMWVTGIDISPQMIAQLRAKARRQGLEDRIEAHADDVETLRSWTEARFDGIVSAFAGLNTIRDLGAFAADASRVLRPQGRLIVHGLAPTDVWTQLRLLARLQWRAARARRARRQRSVIISGQEVQHALLVPAEIYPHVFAPYFRLCRSYALGFLWPQGMGRRMPSSLAGTLGRLEPHLGSHWPFRQWGRFFVLDLEKKASRGDGALHAIGEDRSRRELFPPVGRARRL
jgi:ubiquinone/menaquinone biosynthesis C-methylase UbiE